MYYNRYIMTTPEWIGLTLTLLTIIGIVGVSVRWVLRHYIKDILAELKPNGGSSLKDQVSRLERDNAEAKITAKDTANKIDHLYDLFIEYLSSNKK